MWRLYTPEHGPVFISTYFTLPPVSLSPLLCILHHFGWLTAGDHFPFWHLYSLRVHCHTSLRLTYSVLLLLTFIPLLFRAYLHLSSHLGSTLLSLQIRALSVNVIVHRDSSPTSSFNLSITITDKRGLEQILNELPSVTRAAHLSTVLSSCITLRNHRSANRKACTNKKGYRTAPRWKASAKAVEAGTLKQGQYVST